MKTFCFILFLFSFRIIHAQQPKLVLPIGHSSYVSFAEFSPDGKKIVTVSDDQTVKMWEVISGALLVDLRGFAGSVKSAQFSPDGSKLLTCGDDETVKIWNVLSGTLLSELKGHSSLVNFAQFSQDGRKIVTASIDGTAKIWDANSGAYLMELRGHDSFVNTVCFSPDGKKILSTSGDWTAKIWDVDSGNMLHNLEGHQENVLTGCFSPDGKKVLTTSFDATAKIWDVTTGSLINNLAGDKYYIVTSGEFSGDGKMVITSNRDKKSIQSDNHAQIWDAFSGKLLLTLPHESGVNVAKFSPNGKKIITASGRLGKIWDLTNGKLIENLKGHNDEVNNARFSPDGKYLLTVSNDKSAKLWTSSGSHVLNFQGHTTYLISASFNSDGSKIITNSADSIASIWDTHTGALLSNVGDRIFVNIPAQFSLDGKKIVTSTINKSVKIWDVKSGNKLIELKTGATIPILFDISFDGTKIATTSDSTVFIWDAISGTPLHHLSHKSNVNYIKFLPLGRILITSSNLQSLIWDVNTGKQIGRIKGMDYSSQETFLPDLSQNGKILLTGFDGYVKLWDIPGGKLLKDLNSLGPVGFAAFHPNNKKLITNSNEKNIYMWDVVSGRFLSEFEGHKDYILTTKFSPDGKKLITASFDNTIKVWDANSGKFLFELKGHTSYVKSISFSTESKKIVTTSEDNTAKVWQAESGKILYTFIAFENLDYFAQIPSGYYHCTSRAAKKLHYVTKDLKVISFEQLDVKYNRPDKVLEAIGNTDTALIRSYRKAWQKRVKRLKVDTTAFRDGYSVPEADFANRDSIEFQQKSGTLSLRIKGVDSTYKLDRFNIWVNEAPLFGQRGITIRRGNKNYLDTTITIKLSQGENRIETSITNVNGTESYRMPLLVNYTPAVKQKESIHFIGIGMDQFADAKYNLQYSSKDIRDLSQKLKEKYGTDITIDTIFNENVSVTSVKALKEKLKQINENDKVIIAYSGHGMLSKDFDYYLSTYSINFDKPEENGLPYEELENLLDSIPARKKLMLIDACHSGEVDKEDLVQLNATSDSLIKGLKPVAYKQDGHLGLKNSFELMQSLFVNVGKSTGATIISAAAGTQFALERNDLKNGVFTYSILEAMNKYPTLKISELKKIVGARVEELTKGLQKPTSRNETIAVDWNVW